MEGIQTNRREGTVETGEEEKTAKGAQVFRMDGIERESQSQHSIGRTDESSIPHPRNEKENDATVGESEGERRRKTT